MSAAVELLWDGPADAHATVLLAHGAGADCRSQFLADVARRLADGGVRVARFDFPYMAARAHGERRGPDPMPRLLDAMRAAIAATGAPPGRLVLAGKSMGGRVATMLADEAQVAGVVVFGYPFHPPRKPEQLRTRHLGELRTRCLILQGERDPFGTAAEVPGYALAPAIAVEWFADGDHSLVPRVRSGHRAAAHFDRALALTLAFVHGACGGHGAGQALA